MSIPKPAYMTSGPHLSGYRVTLGYETLAEAQEAHEALAHPQPSAEDDAELREGIADDWSELERLAKEATPGPWSWDETNTPFYNDPDGHSCGGEATGFAEVAQDGDIDVLIIERARLCDAAFIAAANPATILKLISAARRDDQGGA